MADSVRYCIVSDGDGHYWLCPAHRRAEAMAHIEAVEAHWSGSRAGHVPEGDPPADPDDLDYLERINGPHTLTFTDPREDGH